MTKSTVPTMKDVAREAGVALGTVSKVINHIPVGDEYRLKVEDAIRKLNYEVNTYARGLKKQKTYTAALIIPDIINPFFAALSHYVELELYENKYKMLLCCSQGAKEKESHYINMASQNKVDGIIALTYSDISSELSSPMPIITIDRHFNDTVPCVASDNYTGGFIATEKLLENGCTRPLYIRIGSVHYGETNKRKTGYMDACSKHNITPLLLEMTDGDDIKECFDRFLHENKKSDGTFLFDGIFTVNDKLGYEIILELNARGYNVPEDIPLIGFDGIRLFGDGKFIISTIEQPIEQIAKTCVNYLLSPDKESIPPLTLLKVEYRYGGTTRI